MSNTVVYKYGISREDQPNVSLPHGAKILYVGLQGNRWTLWALVDPDVDSITRRLLIVGTGASDDRLIESRFICTFFEGPFVWHVWELGGG